MIDTPKAMRLHIGILGRVNVGKSSFLNFICSQDIAIASPVPGTTTDVVEKAAELLPIGPVLFLDTAGLGDTSVLGEERIKRTLKVLDRIDVALLVVEPNIWGEYEEFVVEETEKRKIGLIVIVNKVDLMDVFEFVQEKLKGKKWIRWSCVDVERKDYYINEFKKLLLDVIPDDFFKTNFLVGDLVKGGDIVVMVVPIDLQAPKGRLILPQVQAIRDVLDADAISVVVKEREYLFLLRKLVDKPSLVICDSQVVARVVADTPSDVRFTTFSILFSRYRGDLVSMVDAVTTIDTLEDGDFVLISEACTHHPIEDDIGRVKIPRWLRQYTGKDIHIDVCAGKDFPEDVKKYKLIIHCGGCMLNRRTMLSRLQKAKIEGVPMTNYGIAISFLQGVLYRALSPFPYAQMLLGRKEGEGG